MTILEGVCFYILQNLSPMREKNRWTNMVSNSAKIVNIIGAHRFNTILRRTADCVDIACTGSPEVNIAVDRAFGQVVEGEAVVSEEGFSPRYDLDRWTGMITKPGHKLEGTSIVGQDLLLSHRQGRHRRGLGVLRHQVEENRAQGVHLRRDQPGDGAGRHFRRHPDHRRLVRRIRARSSDRRLGARRPHEQVDRVAEE